MHPFWLCANQPQPITWLLWRGSSAPTSLASYLFYFAMRANISSPRRVPPNPPLNSDPAYLVIRSFSSHCFLGSTQRLGAGGAGQLHSLSRKHIGGTMHSGFGPPTSKVWFLAATFLLLAMAGCAHQPSAKLASFVSDSPGFFYGFLHGFLILFSFIGSLFTDIRIYSFPNSGGWYDFGFLLGAASFLGGGGASAR